MKYKSGDRVKIRTWESMAEEFGVGHNGTISVGPASVVNNKMKKHCGTSMTIAECVPYEGYLMVEDCCVWYWTDGMIEGYWREEVPIKYFDDSLPEIDFIAGKSDWIDLYSRISFFLVEGEYKMIPLNVAMALPAGYEAWVVPRSSTFKHFGLISTNHIGIIDESYKGDQDEWHFPALLLTGYGKNIGYMDDDGHLVVLGADKADEVPEGKAIIRGTWIAAGDRICQFRIQEHMPAVQFQPVRSLGNESRGGFGTTGK